MFKILRLRLVWLAVVVGAVNLLPADEPVPGTEVQFQTVLSDEEYATKSSALEAAREDLRKRSKTTQPAEGIWLRVIPGDLAGRLGLDTGDIIHKHNDGVVWSSRPNWDLELESREFEVFDESGDRMQVYRIQEKKFGAYFEEYWNPGLRYLRDDSVRGKWDDDFLNACLSWEKEPDFAESALFRAKREGCPERPIVTEVGIAVSLRRNQPQRAADLLDRLDWSSEDPSEELNPVISLRAAMANNRLETAIQIVKANPETFSINHQVLESLLELDRMQMAAEKLTPPLPAPSAAIESMLRDDLTPHLSGQTWYSVRDLLPTIKRGESYHRKVEEGHFLTLKFGVDYPVRNIDYRMRFSTKPSPKRGTTWAKQFVVALHEDDIVDASIPTRYSNAVLEAKLCEIPGDPDRHAYLEFSYYDDALEFAFADHAINLDGEQVIDVQMFRVGGRCEVHVNGNRVLLLPFSTSISLLPGMHVFGMDQTVHRIDFNEWIPTGEP